MHSIQKDMEELRKQLGKGAIQKAYRELLSYMMRLRTRFADRFGASAVSGLYQGYMDMTYFAVFPPFLKPRDLKIAVVFNYDAFRFEAWLVARNRRLQKQYWELFKDSRWDAYRVVAPAVGIDSILECDLAADFDPGDAEALTVEIETATMKFMEDIEKFLS